MKQVFKSELFFLLFTLISAFTSVSSVKGQNLIDKPKEIENNEEQVIYAPFREDLELSFSDTIINSKSYYFSNPNSKDIFRLIVRPGFVKNSKSEFQIKSSDGTIIYSKVFDSFALIMKIFEPDKIPKGANYEAYKEEYGKSLTIGKYKIYFKKNIQHFFDNISFIDRTEFSEILKRGNAIDKEALKELMADNTTNLIHLNCFVCDTGGGSVLYFSKKRGRAIEILGHD